MKELFNRFVSLTFAMALALMLLPGSAYANLDNPIYDEENELITTGDDSADSSSGTSSDAGADATEDETNDSSSSDTSTDATTGDDSSTSGDDATSDSDSTSGDASDGSSSADDATTADDITTKVTKKTTYELKVTATTKPASSKNASVRTVSVSRPKVVATTVTTTTTTNNTTGKVTKKKKTTKKTTKYGLTVKVNVPGKGWKNATLNNAGTAYTYKASGSYIQAVKITPSAKLKKAMKKTGTKFFYRAKSKTFGKLGWAKPGQAAGTTGQNRALTALTLKVTKKIPGSATNHYIGAPSVKYAVKLKSTSKWTGAKKNGAVAGTANWSTATNGLAVKVANASFAGGIEYSVRYSTKDSSSAWSGWSSNYAKLSSDKKVQAVRIRLTGKMAKYYNVYYRVYCGDWCWLGWAKNGQKTGSQGINYPIGALQVKLVAKGVSAPGSTSGRYVSKVPATGGELSMLRKAQSYSSNTSYLILVNRSACRVGVFTGSKGNWKLKYYWKCSPGKSSSPTVSGSFTVSGRGYSFGTSSYTCYYYTQFYGNYLFHSVLYYAGTRRVKDGRLGQQLSHGCVRLAIGNAYWLYKNIPNGTKVYVY